MFFLGIEAEILQPLVEYFYTGKITVTNDNVIGLLEATSLLLLPKVVEACGQFLANHIDEANSLKIWAIATSRNYCGLQWLAGEALRFMQLHFESIWKEPEFILEAKNGRVRSNGASAFAASPPGAQIFPGTTSESGAHRGDQIPPSFIKIRCNRTHF